MLIQELTKYTSVPDAQTNVAPFTYMMYPGRHTTADYWINEFGAPDESTVDSIFVSSFIQDAVIFYAVMTSLLDCIAQQFSFYFLVLTEILYAHYDHTMSRFNASYEYGDQLSFNDTKDIYIDNVYCAALIKSVPSIAQQQDIQNHDKLALKSGKSELINVADPMTMRGRLDELITRRLYGNDSHLYYLRERDGIYNYSRTDLVDLAAFTIDDYDLSLQVASVDLADKRGAQNIDIPIDVFTVDDYPDIDEKYIGKAIPFGYGLIRASEAIPTNSAAVGDDVVYRQALTMTVIGTVEVKVDEEWVIVVPTAVDLVNGEFTVDVADGRNASGVPYECRVLNSILIRNDYASDCIKDMNERFLGVLYTDSAYDKTEWETEEKALCTIGILWNKPVKLYDAIGQIQNAANVGFRYEINAAGRRTIRIDNNARTPIGHVPNTDIQNITELPVQSRKDLLASVVRVNYAHDYMDDADYFVENTDNEDSVLANYRQVRKLIEIDSSMTAEVDAEERAAWHAERFADPPKVLRAELKGPDYYTLRIYDILTIEVTPAEHTDAGTARVEVGREYYGFWTAKVVGIDPQFNQIINVTDLQLIEKIEPIEYLRATPAGAIRSCGREGTAVCKRGLRSA